MQRQYSREGSDSRKGHIIGHVVIACSRALSGFAQLAEQGTPLSRSELAKRLDGCPGVPRGAANQLVGLISNDPATIWGAQEVYARSKHSPATTATPTPKHGTATKRLLHERGEDVPAEWIAAYAALPPMDWPSRR